MTELLSREKELMKLNNDLNQIACNAMDSRPHPHPVGGSKPIHPCSNATVHHKAESRYGTYSKQKGASSLLKRIGAGDGGTDSYLRHSGVAASPRDNKTFTRHKTQKQTNNYGGLSQRGATPRDDRKIRSNEPQRMREQYGTIHNSTIGATATGNHRKQSKASTCKSISNTNATFTVRYRNLKFRTSPSLENLVKEESKSARHPNGNSNNIIGSMTTINTEAPVQRALGGSPLKKDYSADSFIKFLKAKMHILEEDHTRITEELNKQKDLLDKSVEQQKRVEVQRDQAFNINNSLSEQLTKLEKQLEDATKRNKDRSIEQSAQQKEIEISKRELRLLKQTNINLENRLCRANEELDTARTAIAKLKSSERELKEVARSEFETKDKQIKSLKRQRADLLNAYKKQLFLIDNLKRQTTCLEQSTMITFGEKELNKVLDWNSKS